MKALMLKMLKLTSFLLFLSCSVHEGQNCSKSNINKKDLDLDILKSTLCQTPQILSLCKMTENFVLNHPLVKDSVLKIKKSSTKLVANIESYITEYKVDLTNRDKFKNYILELKKGSNYKSLRFLNFRILSSFSSIIYFLKNDAIKNDKGKISEIEQEIGLIRKKRNNFRNLLQHKFSIDADFAEQNFKQEKTYARIICGNDKDRIREFLFIKDDTLIKLYKEVR